MDDSDTDKENLLLCEESFMALFSHHFRFILNLLRLSARIAMYLKTMYTKLKNDYQNLASDKQLIS